MIEESPDIYFYPRYVGAGGWVGILLDHIADDALEPTSHDVQKRWELDHRSRPHLSRSVVDDYWKDAAELTEGTDEFENGACGP